MSARPFPLREEEKEREETLDERLNRLREQAESFALRANEFPINSVYTLITINRILRQAILVSDMTGQELDCPTDAGEKETHGPDISLLDPITERPIARILWKAPVVVDEEDHIRPAIQLSTCPTERYGVCTNVNASQSQYHAEDWAIVFSAGSYQEQKVATMFEEAFEEIFTEKRPEEAEC